MAMNWPPLAVVVAVGFLFLTLRRSAGGLASAKTIAELLPQEPRVIDVRTLREYEAGHLSGALNIPLAELGRNIGRHVPDKTRPIMLHCASGARSAAAKRALEQMGYVNVHNLGSYRRAKSLLAV